ncbi:hypothetical protein ACIPWI_13635 [Streptomyces sp. NPDC090046]|uniref:hypothetical protein n=1 Tax=Streptomyces sp. NPDC090046 TaxID=3365928 RepID=UPI0037F82D80
MRGGIAAQHGGELRGGTHLSQCVQEVGHGTQVVEGHVRGGITAQQRVGRLVRPCFHQDGKPATRGSRGLEEGVRGSPVSEGVGLLDRSHLAQCLQQTADAARIVKEDVHGDPVGQDEELYGCLHVVKRVQKAFHSVQVVERRKGGGAFRQDGGLLTSASSGRWIIGGTEIQVRRPAAGPKDRERFVRRERAVDAGYQGPGAQNGGRPSKLLPAGPRRPTASHARSR